MSLSIQRYTVCLKFFANFLKIIQSWKYILWDFYYNVGEEGFTNSIHENILCEILKMSDLWNFYITKISRHMVWTVCTCKWHNILCQTQCQIIMLVLFKLKLSVHFFGHSVAYKEQESEKRQTHAKCIYVHLSQVL